MNPISHSPSPFDPAACARRLVAARQGASPVALDEATPPDRAMAYAVQDATLREIGPTAGWKVGAKGPDTEPSCAPLPASGLRATGDKTPLGGQMRGVEVEVAVRLGRDLPCASGFPGVPELQDAIDAVLPVIEVVETRLADWRGSTPLAQLADLQTHGALVLGKASAVRSQDVDLRRIEAYLAFDGQPVASTRGANPALDIWRLLGWLAWECVQRGQPLRAGQVVTTGSCTGMLFAPAGAHVQAHLDGIGAVELRF